LFLCETQGAVVGARILVPPDRKRYQDKQVPADDTHIKQIYDPEAFSYSQRQQQSDHLNHIDNALVEINTTLKFFQKTIDDQAAEIKELRSRPGMLVKPEKQRP